MLLLLGVSISFGQDSKPTPPEENDVLRTNTELVQTDVMVFDKRGTFVNGLRPENFELRIDGKPRAISFFDRIVAGSHNESDQLAAARGETRKENVAPVVFDRGRTVFFFVDDLHIAPNNMTITRNLLLHYFDNQMGQDDQVAVTSASGQIGFLQQLSDNKDVLHAAVMRLKARPSLVRDFERPPMSEYQALAIERNNRDVVSYFVDELMKNLPGLPSIAAARVGSLPRTRAEQQVRDRASLILRQAAVITTGTLSSLESLVRSAGKFPGRKLVFFVSDGFFLDLRNSDAFERLRAITSAAARSNVVIYSVDARGLVTGVADASSEAGPDPGGRLQRAAGGELVESQDPMNALATDTGGRAIFNTNNIESAINRALEETSAYYLLAWRPETEEQKNNAFRMISVSIIGHPELIVRMRKGFFNREPPSSAATKAAPSASPAPGQSDAELRGAILAAVPAHQLPVALSLTYVNAPDKGLLLTVAVQTRIASNDEKHAIEVAGVVFNEEGQAGVQFQDQLHQNRTNANDPERDLTYVYPVTIPSGLYQVRVGVRDLTTGAIGTTQDWIEIPDVSKVPLTLSSLIISEGRPGGSANEPGQTAPVTPEGFSVNRRFHRNSSLRFLVFIYSADPTAKPDLAIQLHVMRGNQPVLTTSSRKVNTEGVQDLTKLAYGAEMSLEHLPVGRYVLRVTAIDRTTGRNATQSTRFQIE